MKNIKKMKLYRHPERIYNELNAIGYKDGAPLKAADISPFDQYHYFGTDAIDDAISSLSIDSKKKIMDIGSGIGGPARYMAGKTGCHVTALEIQPDLHDIGSSLTERCGLSGSVRHLCGDILDFSEKERDFDIIVSWLSFLHIPDRCALLKKCYTILKLGGKIFIEDFYKRGEFDKKETKILSEDIYCAYLPTLSEYKKQLADGGFVNFKLTDKTDRWKDFVKERLEKFIKSRGRYIKLYGIDTVKDLEDFYEKMSWLFAGNKLGGLRIMAEKGDLSRIGGN
ncbi:MAG: methyltransferase domain-containing protein [Candidatus Omnitrophica bacterium]|nr:methyltransferase domain-containing protein [Candidatus Omnitrophota bacterium]